MYDIFIRIFTLYMLFCTICWTSTRIIVLINGPDRETIKKFKKICKWEHRDPIRQEAIAYEEHVAKYTEEHNIDWNQYI